MKCPVCDNVMIIKDLIGNRPNYHEYKCNFHTNIFGNKVHNIIAIDDNKNVVGYMIQLDNHIIVFGVNQYQITEIYDSVTNKQMIKINKFIKINDPESIDEFNNICSKLNNLKVFS